MADFGEEKVIEDMKLSAVQNELHEVAKQWDRAMVANDPEAIGRFMADDWVIVGSDGRVGNKKEFIELVASSDLTHNVMETHDMEVRVYEETAVTIAPGISGGHYKGMQFLLKERSSCVFIKQAGSWRCVLTHLSSLPDAAAEGNS